MKLLILGATGLVGGHVLQRALNTASVEQVIAPVRREISAHPKLIAPLVDYERLPVDADWWNVDAAVCALGSTMRQAGSKERFHRIDHDYPLLVARILRAKGVEVFALNSAAGANPESRFFYNRTKGRLEQELEKLDFVSLTFIRPGLIGGDRKEFRLGERLATLILRTLDPVLPRAWRINPAERIAQTLLDSALAGKPGIKVIGSSELSG